MFSREMDMKKVMVLILYILAIAVFILFYLLVKQLGKSQCSFCKIPCYFFYCPRQNETGDSGDLLIVGSNGEVISSQGNGNGLVIGLAHYLRSSYSSSTRNVVSESPAHDVPPKYDDVCKYDIETGYAESAQVTAYTEGKTSWSGNSDVEDMPPPSYEDCYRTIDLINYSTKSCN